MSSAALLRPHSGVVLRERMRCSGGDPALLVGVCLHRGIADPELLDGDGVGEIPARFILSETLLALTASRISASDTLKVTP